MKTIKDAALLRQELDEKLKKFRRVARDRPGQGWICAVREALGMTIGDLGLRLKVTESSVSALQESERKETISLDTLRRAAKALNCTLVYALVPQKSLEATLAERRATIAFGELANVLSLRETIKPENREVVRAYAKTIDQRRVWKPMPKIDDIEKGKERLRRETTPEIYQPSEEILQRLKAAEERMNELLPSDDEDDGLPDSAPAAEAREG